jgi:hypothetical protein
MIEIILNVIALLQDSAGKLLQPVPQCQKIIFYNKIDYLYLILFTGKIAHSF